MKTRVIEGIGAAMSEMLRYHIMETKNRNAVYHGHNILNLGHKIAYLNLAVTGSWVQVVC